MHERWLHSERHALRMWREDRPPAVEEALTRALAGVEALEAAGVLDVAEAARWRERFERDAAGEDAPPPGTAEQREAAEALLRELRDAGGERFDGALHLLATAGIVDRAAWEEPEEPDEWFQRPVGGTEAELVAVLPGPPERRLGYRVAFAMRFADGISFVLDHEGTPDDDWAEWRLTDDRGTHYEWTSETSFADAPPPGATWVELTLAGRPEATFRIAL